jgi:hypothetical protein
VGVAFNSAAFNVTYRNPVDVGIFLASNEEP